MGHRYHIPSAIDKKGLFIYWMYYLTSSGIRTWDLSVCLYLNLRLGDLDHLATTAGNSVAWKNESKMQIHS